MLDYIELEVDAAYDRRRDQLDQDLAQIITETFSSSTPPWEWLAEVDVFEDEQEDLLLQKWLNAHPIEDDFCLDDMEFLADHEIARDKRERRIAATDKITKSLEAKAGRHGNKPWQHGKKMSRDHRVIWSDTARKERERRNGKPAREDIAERLADMTADEPENLAPAEYASRTSEGDHAINEVLGMIADAKKRIAVLRSYMMPESIRNERWKHGAFNRALRSEIIQLESLIETIEYDRVQLERLERQRKEDCCQPQTGFILGQTPFLNPATKAKRRQQKLAKRLRGLKEYREYLRYWPGKGWGVFLWQIADEEIISISARLS